jgi:hypothetical protein
MSLTTSGANSIAKLIFQATAWANVADNAATSPLTNLYISLHTADPGAAGNQTTSEAAYGSYARVALVRTSGGWTVTNNVITPVAVVTFPAPTSGSETELFIGIGSASTGAGVLYMRGALSPGLVVASGGSPPALTTATSITLLTT